MKQTNTQLNVSANSAEDRREIKQYAEIRPDVECGEEVKPAPIQGEGIYLIYADGRSEPYTGTNAKKDVTYIGVVFQSHRFAVSLTESKTRLLKDFRDATKRNDYKERECDAMYDFDSFGNTEKLVADNTALADHLKEGEAIPALGVLEIMCHLKPQINEALDYVGGVPLDREFCWSSTERGKHNAWIMCFGVGGAWHTFKHGINAVRAVAAF